MAMSKRNPNILLAAGLIAMVAAVADYSYVLGYRHGHNEPVAYIPTEGWQAITQRAQVINDCYDKSKTKDDLYNCYVAN